MVRVGVEARALETEVCLGDELVQEGADRVVAGMGLEHWEVAGGVARVEARVVAMAGAGTGLAYSGAAGGVAKAEARVAVKAEVATGLAYWVAAGEVARVEARVVARVEA